MKGFYQCAKSWDGIVKIEKNGYINKAIFSTDLRLPHIADSLLKHLIPGAHQ